MVTIGTKVRNGLGILSSKGKKSWSESGRGSMFGFMDMSKWDEQFQVMKDLGFEITSQQDKVVVWSYHGEIVVFEQYGTDVDRVWVHCSYLLVDKSWCSERQ